MKKNRLVYVIIAIVIIAGVINTYLNRFVFSLAYDTSAKIDIYIGKDYNLDEVEDIVEESLGTKDIIVQKVEYFNDMISITARSISEEQKQNIVNKLNEKYTTEIKAEEVEIEIMPHYDGRDLLDRYIAPMGIAAIIVLIYMAIRYFKLGVIKVIVRTISWSIIIELLYISIISLARIPVSFYTIPLGIVIEILTLTVLANKLEKELKEKKLNKKVAEQEKAEENEK